MAKHWKDFIKQDDTTQKETDEALVLSNLIQAETSEDAKSLDTIAASNINLKALLDEQKNLEEDMHALTGKTDTSKNYNRQYDNEIKTISQKRKEEQQDELKRQKLLEKRKTKTKETNSWLKKESKKGAKKPSKLSSTYSKQKKQKVLQSVTPKHTLKTLKELKPKLSTVAKKAQKQKALINTTTKTLSNANTVLKAANGFNFNVEPNLPTTNTKSKKRTNTVKKSAKTIRKVSSFIKKASKTVDTVVKTTDKISKTYNTFSNTIEKIDSISNSKDMPLKDVSKLKKLTDGKKEVKPNLVSKNKKSNQFKSFKAPIKTIDTIVSTTKQVSKTGKTISNTLNTVNTKQSAISNQLNTIKEQSNPFNKREIVKPLKVKSTNAEHTIPVNKATNLFNNANQYLNKTDTATKHFESVFNRIDSINKKAKKSSTAFAMPSVNNIFTKKESQTKGFSINPNTLTTIKKVVEQLPLKKASKPKNNKSFI
jgi:hypothetical protein